MARDLKRVCVFCGSSLGIEDSYRRTADLLGRTLAGRGIELVYGGGRVGLMGVVADAALGAGGRVVGVLPKGLFTREVGHEGLSELHEVASMHERKTLMYDLSDAFVALPGGFGTLDELFEILTWAQLRIHAKPVGLLNVAGFFTPLLAWLDQVVAAGLLKPKHRELVLVADAVPELLDKLAAFTPPPAVRKWDDTPPP